MVLLHWTASLDAMVCKYFDLVGDFGDGDDNPYSYNSCDENAVVVTMMFVLY